jgi:hypothetical protein
LEIVILQNATVTKERRKSREQGIEKGIDATAFRVEGN